MPAAHPTHRERFISAIEACLSLIEEDDEREEATSLLAQFRAEKGSRDGLRMRRLISAIRSVQTIDAIEAQRVLALFARNGDRWPD